VTWMAVVVCVHRLDRVPMLVQAVASLRAQDRPPDGIVVVVDGDVEVLEATEKAVPDTEVVWTGGGRGLSRARNEGVARTTADMVAFLDDDAVADPSWLGRLEAAVDSPSVLGASGRSLPWWESSAPHWMPPELLWTVGCSYRGMPEGMSPVRNFFGGCGLVRRDVFVEVDGFDPALGRRADGVAGGEEADFCARALAANPAGCFIFEPSAVIHHYVPDTRADPRYVLRRCWADGQAKAWLLVTSGFSGLGPERRFARRALAALAGSPGSGRREERLVPVQSALLAAGVLSAGLGCLAGLPGALMRRRSSSKGDSHEDPAALAVLPADPRWRGTARPEPRPGSLDPP
jgi:GT2 family glycosyltransferase